jgi:hypothetical protein
MNTELYIENYRADITKEISALLNLAIDDIKNFSSRSTTWSRTIVLPGTANNNKLFGHIFQVGQSNSHNGAIANVGFNFNAARSANVVLFQDQIQAFKGVLRLLQINVYDGLQGDIEYEVSIFGNLSGLNTKLTGALLEALDFQAYNHIFNVTNIVSSWDNPGGSGVYYPLIDYGNASVNKHDWDIKTFRPALYVREYIDKMFAAAGYRYQCVLFDTPRFKSIVIPHNQKEVRINQSIVATGGLSADPGFSFLYFDGDPDDPDTILFNAIPFNNLNSSIFTGTLNAAYPAWGTSKFTYTDTPTVTLKIRYTVSGTHWGTDSGIQFTVNKNGDAVNGYIPSTVVNIPQTGGNTFVPFLIQGEVDVTFNINDYFEMWLYHGATGTWDVHLDFTSLEIVSSTGSSLLVPITLGQTLICNDCIPKNIRQIDFLVAIVKLFNLYVYEDKNDPFLIYITPYIDFYSPNTSNAVDWTLKLNRGKPIKVRPMSELNAKIYKLRFKPDSDYYNELYRKRYNEGYGDRIYDSEYEFSAQTNEFELVFSATPMVGYNGEDKVYSTIFKRTGTAPSVTEESIDSNIRLLQTKKITGVLSWDMKDGSTVISTLTRYGYAGHLDDPDVPTNDLNFGAPKELFFVLSAGSISNNQFNAYWASYMREITDKDSKLVTANFYLTAKDILNLDFSKYVYFDGVAYRLNSIKDYNVTRPDDCVVELLKVNSSAYTEQDASSGPPEGCYLLWSDENTLDWDDDEPLLYGDCNTNPGDGEPPVPGETFYVNWTFSKITSGGSMTIKVNGTTVVSSGTNGESGSFVAVVGDNIESSVISPFAKRRTLLVTNDVDGVMFDGGRVNSFLDLSYTFTVVADKNYSIQGGVN